MSLEEITLPDYDDDDYELIVDSIDIGDYELDEDM